MENPFFPLQNPWLFAVAPRITGRAASLHPLDFRNG